MYVNTNGNITFNAGLGDFTPDPFPVASQPMIAPYWSDVDIRGDECEGGGGGGLCANPQENGVWWHLEPGRVVVTWDNVGYYACSDDKKMSFQLIITEPQVCNETGDFDVEFRYNRCEWEVGTADGGDNGMGFCASGSDAEDCSTAQVGFDAGNQRDFVSIPGSRLPGISERVCTGSNVGVPGVYRFRVRRGLVECADGGRPCETGMMGACGEGRTQCVGATTECRPFTTPQGEICDAVDNDCDGSVDEDDDLCPQNQICDRGSCIAPCFEGSCGEGQVCNDDGSCIDAGCESITCSGGERCIAGQCTDVCEGVVCPRGQSCRAGSCVDVCGELDCGFCRVCEESACVAHCAVRGCPLGQACEEDGRCVESACLNVRCGPGRVCREGRCADNCDDVVCPRGQACDRGMCVDESDLQVDAGTDQIRRDAGPDPGHMNFADAGPDTIDGGDRRPPPDDGCSCRTYAGSSSGLSPLWLAAIGIAFVVRRRRRRS